MSTVECLGRPQCGVFLLPMLLVTGLVCSLSRTCGDNAVTAGVTEPTQAPDWGPAMLTFVVGGSQVWGIGGAGQRASCLLREDREDPCLDAIQWSPDGRKLVYQAYNGTWQATYLRPRDLSGPPQLLCPIAWDPRMSPDWSLLACNHADTMEEFAVAARPTIVRMQRPGGQPDITDLSPLLEGYYPRSERRRNLTVRWSPSAHLLATCADRWTVLIDVNSRSVLKVEGCRGVPEWSPDGQHLAFTWFPPQEVTPEGLYVYPAPASEIAVIKRNEAGLTNLTNDPRGDRYPKWSPDGRRIAFLRSETEPGTHPGGDAALPDSHVADGLPTHSFRHPGFIYRQELRAIWVMAPDGTGQRQLSPEVLTDDDFAWSRDGRWIAYKTNKQPPEADSVWVVGLDGAPPVLVATGFHGIGDIAWRPAMTVSPTKPD